MVPARRERDPLPSEQDEAPRLDDGAIELLDFPAAIVCASCGMADCPGCRSTEPEVQSASGVVLVVPWERPEQGVWRRFWATTQATTEGAEVFFAGLPDGPVEPALTYALVAESVAAGSCTLVFAGVALAGLGLLFPVVARSILLEPAGQAALGRVLLAAWFGLGSLLVGVHLLHGGVLHAAASRHARGRPVPLRRALRFGLYTAGLDVVACPVGIAWLLGRGGLSSLRKLRSYVSLTPNRATSVTLRNLYQIDEPLSSRLRVVGLLVAVGAMVVGIVGTAALVFAAA